MNITELKFFQATGNHPVQDDLERANCNLHNSVDHLFCGWCDRHDKPRSQCGECFKEMAASAKEAVK